MTQVSTTYLQIENNLAPNMLGVPLFICFQTETDLMLENTIQYLPEWNGW